MANNSRADRFTGRATLRSITSKTRCFDCGRRSVMAGGGVAVRQTSAGVVGFAGLSTCGAVWVCPVCNSKIMARRAIEIGVALAWAQREGLQTIWGALTCRHTIEDPLRQVVDLQRDSWRRVVGTRAWRSVNATVQTPHVLHGDSCVYVCSFDHDKHDSGCEFVCPRSYDVVHKLGPDSRPVPGRVGYIRATELNIGSNGWHPHFHPIILYRGSVAAASSFADTVVTEWVDAVEHFGGEALKVGANGLRVLEGVEVFDALTGYVTKQTYDPKKLSIETVWSQGKTGRKRRFTETVSHWSLLHAIEQGLADQAGQWLELETAMDGVRMITWSRGLRSFAGLTGEEATDSSIASEEVGSRDDNVCVLSSQGWLQVRDRPDVLALILDSLETSGWSGLQALLDFHGIEYETPEDYRDQDSDFNSDFSASERERERATTSH